MAADKVARRALRWRTRERRDYVGAAVVVSVPDRRALSGYFQVQAHRLRDPLKVSFSLVFRRARVLALDIEPGRWHRNLLTGSVNATHWQQWPDMEAEPDARNMPYSKWLNEFLARAKIRYDFPITQPPRGVQLDFWH